MTRAGLGCGVFLVVAGVYLSTGSGRIDSIDGQVRFEATAALLDLGRLQIRDPAIQFAGVPAAQGRLYSPYGPAASVAAAPLVALGGLVADPRGELRRFLFSLTGGLFGAATAALLFLFLCELGLGQRQAVFWALAAAFATYLWPGAETVLDQGQHAFWTLLAVWLGHLAARRDSQPLAAAGGLAAGVLVLHQIPFMLHLPVLGLATLENRAAGAARTTPRGRYLFFLAAAGVGCAALMAYRLSVFGALFQPSPVNYPHPPLIANPLAGIAGLLLSPGKGLLLYSPALLLAVLGVRGLAQRSPGLVRTIAVLSALQLLFIGSLSIWHGEWSWGPRYLLVLIPLWCLAMPFASVGSPRKWLVATLLAAGLFVNLLGLAVVHERYYYERGLQTYFWYRNNGIFWRDSALFARLREVSTLDGKTPGAMRDFAPAAYRGLFTYVISPAGPLQPAPPPWLEEFLVFRSPRPWPLWVWAAGARGLQVPLPAARLLTGFGVATLVGAALLAMGFRRSSRHGDPG